MVAIPGAKLLRNIERAALLHGLEVRISKTKYSITYGVHAPDSEKPLFQVISDLIENRNTWHSASGESIHPIPLPEIEELFRENMKTCHPEELISLLTNTDTYIHILHEGKWFLAVRADEYSDRIVFHELLLSRELSVHKNELVRYA